MAKVSVKNAKCSVCGTASVLNQDFSFLQKGMNLSVSPAMRKSSKVETIYVQPRKKAAGSKMVTLF